MGSERTKCEACGKLMPTDAKWRSDNDGFTACLPAFPRSDTEDRPMRGKCYRDQTA